MTRLPPVPKFSIGPVFRYLGGDCGDYRTGKQKVLCPFHGDSRPSAQIDFSRNTFRCWVCEVSGDALDLLRQQEGLTFAAALERAESLAGSQTAPLRPAAAEPPSLFGRSRAGS
jgi:hypothetical protein